MDTIDITARTTIKIICGEFQDIYHLEEDHLTAHDFYQQKLLTASNTPIYHSYRRKKIKTQVHKFIKEDLAS